VGLDDHRGAVEKLQKSNKAASKQVRSQLRELAQLQAFQHLHSDPIDLVACVHRDDGDMEFMNILANQLSSQVWQLVAGSNYHIATVSYRVCLSWQQWVETKALDSSFWLERMLMWQS